MPDCYLCGDYIERGRGHRRHVEVESSTRVYFGRRGGSSYGTRAALRTLCRKCAEIEERVSAGVWLRTLLYIVAYLASAGVGWQLVMGDVVEGQWIGLACLFGVPVIIGGYIVDAFRRRWITADVDSNSTRCGVDTLARPASLVTRTPLILTPRDEAPIPPKIDFETLPASRDHIWTYRDDDNLFTWSDRVMGGLVAEGQELMVARAALLMFARAAYPEVGEDIRTFAKRAKARMKEE